MSGNMGRLNGNLYVILKFTQRANLDEKNADMVQFTQDETGNGLSRTKDTFSESLQLQMSVLHQSMCIFNDDGWVKYKGKATEASDPNENVITTCNSKLECT